MKRYLIEEAMCDLTAGGFACGPVPGSVVVSVRYNDGTESRWLHFVETDGILNPMLTEEDVFDALMEEDFDDEDIEYLEAHAIDDFNGIGIGGENYDWTFRCMSEDPDNPAIPLLRYMIALVRCPMDEVEGLIAMAKGKYADELDIPMSDAEEDYLEELAGEEDE